MALEGSPARFLQSKRRTETGSLPALSRLLDQPDAVRFRFFRLVLCLGVILLPIIVIPKIPTMSPAVHSKDLALRFLLFPLIMAAAWCRERFSHRKISWVDMAFGWFFLAHILSTLFSGRISYCFFEQWQMDAVIVVGWLCYRSAFDLKQSRMLLYLFVLAAVLCSVYGFSAWLGHDFLHSLYPFKFEENEMGGRNYIHSFFGNPEYFSSFVAPIAVLALGLFVRRQASLANRILMAASCLFILLVLALSGGRNGLLGFAVGALIVFASHFGLFSQKARKRLVAMALAGVSLMAIMIVVFSTSNPINRRGMRLAQRILKVTDFRTDSIRERVFFYSISTVNICDNPIWGGGPGTYRLDFFPGLRQLIDRDGQNQASIVAMATRLDNKLAEHAHNDYLEFWCDLGLFGIAPFLLLIALTIAFFVKNVKFRSRLQDTRGIEAYSIQVILFAAIAAAWVNAGFSFPFHMPERAVECWVLWGTFFARNEALDRLTGHKPHAQDE